MLEGAGLDAAGLDELIDLLLLEADDPAEPVGRDLPFVDEAVQRAGGDAQSVLTESWGRTPTDREVAPYWRSLVDTNRSRLADPNNPDLIFSQQALEVPPPPAG